MKTGTWWVLDWPPFLLESVGGRAVWLPVVQIKSFPSYYFLLFLCLFLFLQEEIPEMGWDEHPGHIPSSWQRLWPDEDRWTQHTLQQVKACDKFITFDSNIFVFWNYKEKRTFIYYRLLKIYTCRFSPYTFICDGLPSYHLSTTNSFSNFGAVLPVSCSLFLSFAHKQTFPTDRSYIGKDPFFKIFNSTIIHGRFTSGQSTRL